MEYTVYTIGWCMTSVAIYCMAHQGHGHRVLYVYYEATSTVEMRSLLRDFLSIAGISTELSKVVEVI